MPDADPGDPVRPLDGIRIADFTQLVAGPTATMVLADLGADVIKVEGSDRTDRTRVTGATSAMFASLNRNKRSIFLNLKSAEGTEAARRLIRSSDVVVESFRPGVMDRLGLGFASLVADQPRLVYASLSGFAPDGSQARRGAADLTIQAESGLMALTGEEGGQPLKAGFAAIDLASALALSQGIISALYRLERTGQGGRVEVSLYDTAMFLQASQIAEYAATGREPERMGNSVRHGAPADVVRTKDGPLMISAIRNEQWVQLCEALGIPEVSIDPRFVTEPDRIANRPAMLEVLEEHLRTRTRDEWVEELEQRGLVVSSVKGYDEVMADARAEEGVLLSVPYDGTDFAVPRLPLRLSREPQRLRYPPPRPGEHTDDLLRELGCGPGSDGVPAAST